MCDDCHCLYYLMNSLTAPLIVIACIETIINNILPQTNGTHNSVVIAFVAVVAAVAVAVGASFWRYT